MHAISSRGFSFYYREFCEWLPFGLKSSGEIENYFMIIKWKENSKEWN